jgi:hypothetical protein
MGQPPAHRPPSPPAPRPPAHRSPSPQHYKPYTDWRSSNRYDWNRPDPRYGAYDPQRYYRDGRYYSTRRLGRYDRIYRGYDGRYYCRRSDGTTGLIIGTALGGILGNTLAYGDSKTISTLLGAGIGAALGHELDRGEIQCR